MGRRWSGQFTDLNKKDSTDKASQQPDPLSSSTSADNLKKRKEDAKVEGRYMEMEEEEWRQELQSHCHGRGRQLKCRAPDSNKGVIAEPVGQR
jgi:hypothetical protein